MCGSRAKHFPKLNYVTTTFVPHMILVGGRGRGWEGGGAGWGGGGGGGRH